MPIKMDVGRNNLKEKNIFIGKHSNFLIINCLRGPAIFFMNSPSGEELIK